MEKVSLINFAQVGSGSGWRGWGWGLESAKRILSLRLVKKIRNLKDFHFSLNKTSAKTPSKNKETRLEENLRTDLMEDK